MCPRNESDLGHRLSLVMNFKTLAKKLLAVRPKTVLGIRKRKKRMAITHYSTETRDCIFLNGYGFLSSKILAKI